MTTRREFLLLLAGLLALPAAPTFALADDGKGGGGGSGGGGGGHGGGGDDKKGGDDRHGGDDRRGGDDRHGGKGKGNAKKIRDDVKKGKAASLREVLALVRKRYPGEVVSVDVADATGRLVYAIRIIDERNRRMDVRVDAALRRIVSAEFM